MMARRQVVAVIQARKGSTRQPGKTMMDLAGTYEYDDYYKILPAIHNWSMDPARINGGVKVSPDFTYRSDNNPEWMSIDSLRAWITLHRDKIGKL